MRLLGKALLVLILLMPASAAFAQVLGDGGEVFSPEAISDGCGDTMSPDECMFGGNWTTSICSNAACPACGFDQTMTKSICYRLYGNTGYCACQGTSGVGRDKNGNTFPHCNASGSCAARP